MTIDGRPLAEIVADKQQQHIEPITDLTATTAAAKARQEKRDKRKRKKHHDRDQSHVIEPSYTVPEFCAAERISVPMYYKLRKAGKAPRTFKVGASTRISPEARRKWRAEREAEAGAA